MFVDFMVKQKELDNEPDMIIANAIGVSKHSIGGWRNGKSRPSLKNFSKVMKYYDVDKIYARAMWKDLQSQQKNVDVQLLQRRNQRDITQSGIAKKSFTN